MRLFNYNLYPLLTLFQIHETKESNDRILGFLFIPYIAITIFRTWLVGTLTFQKNGANRQRRNVDEEREQLRQIEIQDA